MTRDIVPARKLTAIVGRVMIADGDTFETRDVPQISVDLEGIALDGLLGERHRGHARAADARVPWYPRGTPIRNARQISIVCSQELAEVAARMEIAEIRPEWLGANLVIEGVPSLSMLPRGTRLFFPTAASLAVEEQNVPCKGPGRMIARNVGGDAGMPFDFVRKAARKRGLVAWVERAGVIRVGDTVEIRIPEQWIYA